MSHERVRILLGEAEKSLNIYQAELAAGNPIVVDDFEKIVRDFCQELAQMPREDAKLYENSLQALEESLGALAQMLTIRRDEIKTKIKTVNISSQAHNAYQAPKGSN